MGKCKPVIKQIKGDKRWAARIKVYNEKPVIHFMSAGLLAVPDSINDLSGIPLIKDIDSAIEDNDLTYTINIRKIGLTGLTIMSPELEDKKRPVQITETGNGYATIRVNLEGIKIYAVAQ